MVSFKSERAVLSIMIAAYILVFGLVTALRHYQFQTQAWDLGIYTQTFWNTIHGRIMQNDIEEIPNSFGVHFSPWLFVLVPGFAIFQTPYYLLSIQTIALALGAVPIYYLARYILHKRALAFVIAGGYLLYAPLHWINWYDFHSVAFVVPFLLAGIYFIETGRWKYGAVFLALAATTQENSIIAVGAVGVWYVVRSLFVKADKQFLRTGIIIIGLSLIYFIVVVSVIMPAFGGGLMRIDRYAQLGGSFGEIIKNIFQKPQVYAETIFMWPKVAYVFWLFLPVGFLVFVSPVSLVLLIPGLMQNLLTNFASQFSGNYQYDAILVPGIFVGLIFGLKSLLRFWQLGEYIIKWCLMALFLFAFIARSPISPRVFPTAYFSSNPIRDAYRQMVGVVPAGVSVAAHTNLVPHLATREHIYMLGYEPSPVDMLLVDGESYFGFQDQAAFRAYIEKYARSGNYSLRLVDEKRVIIVRNGVNLNK
jgi:uncharacterized membrane protein